MAAESERDAATEPGADTGRDAGTGTGTGAGAGAGGTGRAGAAGLRPELASGGREWYCCCCCCCGWEGGRVAARGSVGRGDDDGEGARDCGLDRPPTGPGPVAGATPVTVTEAAAFAGAEGPPAPGMAEKGS